MARCLARRRINRTHAQAEAIAARNARTRIRASFDDHVSRRLGEINEVLWQMEPLVREMRQATRKKWTFG